MQMIGWREWLALPELGIPAIKAKIDTGARTSCLHTFKQEEFTQGGAPWVRFWLHPLRNHPHEICCEAPIIDRRYVRDSGGHKEYRRVICTSLHLSQWERSKDAQQLLGEGGAPSPDSQARRPLPEGEVLVLPIEITLSNRESMLFRMLLGRTAMLGKLSINPALSFTQGKPDMETLQKYYPEAITHDR